MAYQHYGQKRASLIISKKKINERDRWSMTLSMAKIQVKIWAKFIKKQQSNPVR
jgi:hypothetical protein